jgi:hypothetical protein
LGAIDLVALAAALEREVPPVDLKKRGLWIR